MERSLKPASLRCLSLYIIVHEKSPAHSTFPTFPLNWNVIDPNIQLKHSKMTSSTIISDASLGPVYFWREFEEPYGFLSQWYESAFEVDGVTYESAEMWMMIQKAKLFGDEVS